MRPNRIVPFLLIVIGICVSAYLLRFYHLAKLPIFADEAIYIRWAQVMKAEPTLRFLPLSDGKQPLFMWVTIPFLGVFSNPLIAGRMVSVLTGVASVIGIYLLSFSLFKNKWYSFLPALIYAISPFSVFFDRMALTDSMLCMFGVYFVLIGVINAKLLRFDLAFVSGFILGFALLTKSPALYFSLLYPFVFILGDFKKKDRYKKGLKILAIIGITYLIGYGMYNILRLGPNFHMLKLRNYDYVYPLNHVFVSPFDPLKGHLGGIWDYFIKMGPYPLIVMVAFGLYFGFKTKFKEFLVLALFSFVPILINSEYARVVTARYILFCLPFIFIIAGQPDLFKGLLKKIYLIVMVMFIVTSLIFNQKLLTNPVYANLPQGERNGYLEEWTSGVGLEEISNYLIDKYRDKENGVVVGTEGFFGTLPDGLQIYLNKYPQIVVIGVGLGFEDIPQSLVDSKASGNDTYLVINESRLMLKKTEIEKLELISTYKKADRKVGSREYNLFGPSDTLLFYKLK